MAVHLYGGACDMAALRAVADRHGLALIEDAAEALGTTIGGRHAGTFGDAAAFSFFGNKTVTTGEGGMVVCDDPALADRLRQARGQGQSFTRRYWHEVMGFNYRMTNVAAAIGCAQMERLDAILARKRALAARYRVLLAGLPVAFQQAMPGVESAEWLVSVLLPEGADREAVMAGMAARGVETRPVFHCAHTMPVQRQAVSLPVAEGIAARGMSLPSFPGLTDAEQDRVAEALAEALRACS